MNNLQELTWHEQQGWASTKSPLTEYQVALCGEKYRVLYTKRSDGFAREATGFATIEDAKTWCWKHYNEKMQPYVKPMPTWISVKDSLPTHHQEVIVYRHDGKEANIEYSLYFNAPYFNDDGMIGFGDVKNGGDFLTDVYYWQPIETKALYEAMAMQLQISEVVDD